MKCTTVHDSCWGRTAKRLLEALTSAHPFFLTQLLMNLVDKSLSTRASVLILYGTQTGTSQEVAGDVARALRRLRFSCRLVSFGDYVIVCHYPILFHLSVIFRTY